MPPIGFSSLICWKPISASPRATTWPTGSAGIMRALPRTWSSMPSFLNISRSMYTPLALSEYAMDFAPSSTWRNLSSVEMSGTGAPCFTTRPIRDAARSWWSALATAPSATSLSSA